MRRTPQEIVELVVFGLIALLLGTGVLWLLGAVFGIVGTVLGWLAALLWGLLSFLVPVALVAGAVVLIVRWAQGRSLPGSSAPMPAAGSEAGMADADRTIAVPGAGADAAAAAQAAAGADADAVVEEATPPGEDAAVDEADPDADVSKEHLAADSPSEPTDERRDG